MAAHNVLRALTYIRLPKTEAASLEINAANAEVAIPDKFLQLYRRTVNMIDHASRLNISAESA